jgi:hypothetical protein
MIGDAMTALVIHAKIVSAGDAARMTFGEIGWWLSRAIELKLLKVR